MIKIFINALTRYSSIDLVLEKPERNLLNHHAYRFIRIRNACDTELWPLTDDYTEYCRNNSEIYRLWPSHLNIMRSDLSFSCTAFVFSEGVVMEGKISEKWILKFLKTIINGKSLYVRGKPNTEISNASHIMYTSDTDNEIFADNFIIY